MLNKVLTHTDTGVRDFIRDLDMCLIKFLHSAHEADPSAILRILDGVAEEIHQHFTQTYLISHHIGIREERCTFTKCEMTVCDESARDFQNTTMDGRQVCRFWLKFHLPALYAADIKDIIQKSQKVMRADFDFLQILPDRRIRILFKRDLGKSNNRIHWSTDIV